MKTIQTTFASSDDRRDKRMNAPGLVIRLGDLQLETLNWSLGGFLATAMMEDIRAGQIMAGTLRLIGESEEGEFVARVIRYDANKLTLAMRFVDLDDKTFNILDRAARRRFRSGPARTN